MEKQGFRARHASPIPGVKAGIFRLLVPYNPFKKEGNLDMVLIDADITDISTMTTTQRKAAKKRIRVEPSSDSTG